MCEISRIYNANVILMLGLIAFSYKNYLANNTVVNENKIPSKFSVNIGEVINLVIKEHVQP